MTYHRQATGGFAELVGALDHEVVAMNTLTVNLHILMASFYRPTADRYKILIESGAFPSDQYAAASQLRLHGFDPDTDLLEWSPRDDELLLRTDDLAAMLEQEGESVALILLPGVKSQQMRDTFSSYLRYLVRGEQDDKTRTGKKGYVSRGGKQDPVFATECHRLRCTRSYGSRA